MMRLVMLFVFVGLSLTASPQERSVEQMMEDHAYAVDSREDEEDLQQLQQFRHKPLNLNIAGRDELSFIPFISGQQIEQFLQYRSMLGPLHHVLELQAIPGWDAELVRKVLPFVTVREEAGIGKTLKDQVGKARQALLLRTSSGRSPGLLLRYRVQAPLIQAGISIEKDRGEELWQQGKGIAFLSAHLAVRGNGVVRSFFVGDYLVNMGQGLLLWQGRAFRKSGATVLVKRQLPAFQAYRSNDENRFMRGIAVSLGKGRLGADLFASRNLQDANTMTDSQGHTVVTSLLYSGIHRTAAELADKNSLAIFSTGGSLRYSTGRLRIAVNSVRHGFSLDRQKGDEPYRLYDQAGRSLLGAGISGQYTLGNMHWFGEWSQSGGGRALLQGVMIAADKRLDIAILGRSISTGHRSFGSSAFTESSTVSNEEGVYLGLCWRLSGTLALDLYSDHFRSRWLRYRLDRPSYGQDHYAQLTWQPNKKSRLFLRWKQETKMENGPSSAAVRPVDLVTRRTIRFHVEQQVTPAVEWRTRLEWVTRAGNMVPETGFAFFMDLFLKMPGSGLTGNFRLMGFRTDSYDTRIYAYDNDVMYYGLVTARYGQGAIAYANARWQASNKLDLFIKCQSSWTRSGQSSEIRFQLIFSW